MKPWRRTALGFAAAAAVLFIAAAIALHVMVDPERLKSLAREKSLSAWSRDLAIGDMSLQLLPSPSLQAIDVTVADAPGEKDPWHLHVDRMAMGLEPWALVRGDVRPREVRIEGDFGRHGKRMKVDASFALFRTEDTVELRNVDATVGKRRVTGDARFSKSGATPVFDVRVQVDHLDWGEALVEAGEPPVGPLPPGELFYDRPIAWPLLVALKGRQGTIEATLGSLRLRNGVELRQVKASMAFEGDKLHIRRYTANLLGGSAAGSMRFDGAKKEVRADLEGKGWLLERWFKERRREVPFTGGPMAITASVVATGNSLRDLSKSMTGPVAIRMGPGVYASQKAGDAEAMMVAFSKKDSTGHITFECAGANLPFVQGRAERGSILGLRSDVSRLITSGYISLRDKDVDLRGRLRPKPGMGVGLAAIAGDIRIAGNIRALKMKLDPAAQAKVIARTAAAIATLGLSLRASAAANAAREDIDPCEAVFSR